MKKFKIKTVVYGSTMGGNDTNEGKGAFVDYFYLHGKAQDENGFDLMTISKDKVHVLLSEGLSLCKIKMQNSDKEKDGIIIKWFSNHGRKMKGYVLLLSDLENIGCTLEEFHTDMYFSMFECEIEYLQEKHPQLHRALCNFYRN